MSIRYSCPRCQKTIKAKSSYSGRQVDCPGCQTRHIVPASSSVEKLSRRNEFQTAAPSAAPQKTQSSHLQISCGSCNREFRVRVEMRGKDVLCPKCGQRTTVPAGENSRPSPGDVQPLVQVDPQEIRRQQITRDQQALEEAERQQLTNDAQQHAQKAKEQEQSDQERLERIRKSEEARKQERVEIAQQKIAELERQREAEQEERRRALEEESRLAAIAHQEEEIRRRKEKKQQEKHQRELERNRLKEQEEEAKKQEQAARERIDSERRQREQETARKAEQKRLEEERARQLEEQQQQLAEMEASWRAERERQREEQERQLREEAESRLKAEEEQRRATVERWEAITSRSQELLKSWTSSQDRVPLHEQLCDRRNAFAAWQCCQDGKRYAAALSEFERAETARWAIERASLEATLMSPPGERFIPPVRNRWSADLVRKLSMPVNVPLAGVSWPMRIVLANPLSTSQKTADNTNAGVERIDQQGSDKHVSLAQEFRTGLEFAFPQSELTHRLAQTSSDSPAWNIVASLFWFQLPVEVMSCLARSSDLSCLEVLSLLTSLQEAGGWGVDQSMVRHALALYWINIALIREVAFISGFFRSALGYWDIALAHWCRLLEDQKFWELLSGNHTEHAELVTSIHASMPWFLSSMMLQLAQAHAQQPETISSERLISVVRRSSLPDEFRDAGTVAAVQGGYH